jgi:UDP-2-acetamido-3-amino-2,3-dideoxy-glucuronate N-acetyltransferase
MMNKLRIAIIGTGRWGKNLLREFNTCADVVYVVHGNNPETSRWLTETHPHIQSVSYDIVLMDTSIAAVVIATPIATHYEIARKALEAGKHVFLEKPGCSSREQLEQLISLAQKKLLGLQIGYIFLHHPAYTFLKQNISGPINSIVCSWEKFGSFEERIVGNLACHEFSLLYGFKECAPSQVRTTSLVPGISTGDIVNIGVTYPDDSTASLHINRISPNKRKSITITTPTTLWFWEDTKVWKSTDDKPYRLVFESTDSPLAHECMTFITMITSSTPHVIHTDIASSVHASLASL